MCVTTVVEEDLKRQEVGGGGGTVSCTHQAPATFIAVQQLQDEMPFPDGPPLATQRMHAGTRPQLARKVRMGPTLSPDARKRIRLVLADVITRRLRNGAASSSSSHRRIVPDVAPRGCRELHTLSASPPARYKAIVKPMDMRTSGALLWTCAKAGAIWLLSVLLAIPEAVFSQVVAMQGGDNVTFLNCVPYPLSDQTHPKAHAVALFLVYFLLPLAVISVYYYHIARALMRSARDMPGEVSEHTKRQMETRKRLAKTVLVLVGVFAACWLPNHLLYLYRSFRYQEVADESLAHLVLTLLARILSFSSSCVNPLALYLLSDSFRRHFQSQLRCGGGGGGSGRPDRRASYLNSTSHIRLTSVRKAAATGADRQEA